MQSLNLLLWAVRAVSFFNTVAFLWLGMAVLLNAQERKPVTWVTGIGMTVAGLFFAVHSTLVGREIGSFEADLSFWWHFLWLLFVVPPYGWYLVAGWYSGALEKRPIRLEFLIASFLGAIVLVLMVTPGVLPAYGDLARGTQAQPIRVSDRWPAVFAYPIYSVLCFALALVVLYRPGASKRFMGDLGQSRARPWLVAATLILLAVTAGAGAALAWALETPGLVPLDLSARWTPTLLGIDLAISALLALGGVLAGRAIVSYEIFTGAVLPRGGLRRHWWNSLILAGGYGVLMGGSLSLPVEPIYRLILATLLISVFYALLSWRSYLERERNIQRLRPFVASQRLYEQILKPKAPMEVDVGEPFRALCEEVLGARIAHLVPLGPMAPLVERPLSYPSGTPAPAGELAALTGHFQAPGVLTVPLDASRIGGARWAVPLWSERGLIGALLLGEKRDGGLYVQEEIEVARSACERLIDIQASAGMASRLMAAQRQRMGETQILDWQARRVLHDEVLPQLHTALLALSAGNGGVGEVAEGLAAVHHRISDLLRAMPSPTSPQVSRSGLVRALRAMVDGEFHGAFDGVTFSVGPEAESIARDLSPLVAEVAYGAAREGIRNAGRHGRGKEQLRPLHLKVSVVMLEGLGIEIEDDGVGMVEMASGEGGIGQGLALHSTMMAVIGGTLSVEPSASGGTLVSISLPVQAERGKQGVF